MEDAVLKNAAGYGRVAEQATTESEWALRMNERGRRTLVSRDVCEANSVATEGCVEQPTLAGTKWLPGDRPDFF